MAEASLQEVELALRKALEEAGLKPEAAESIAIRVRHLAKVVARDAYASNIQAAQG